MNPDQIRAQAALLDQHDLVKAAIARVDDAILQKAFIYQIEATDHAQSNRFVEFQLTPDESALVFEMLKEVLNARMKAIESQL